jgi:hypothetical protein
VTDYTIKFKTRGVDTRLSDAQVARERIQASMGMMTVNELRAELGLDPLDGPVGEMLVAEVRGGGGMGGPAGPGGGGIGGAIEELVDQRVEEAREDLRQDVRTEQRVTPSE